MIIRNKKPFFKTKKFKIVLNESQPLPFYATEGSAGMDVSSVEDDYTLKPMERKLFDIGIKGTVPAGLECGVRPRSGLAIKNGITVLNSPGTIDCDYINSWKVILINLSNEDFVVTKGMRIAQLVFSPYVKENPVRVVKLIKTKRRGGFGSSGL